ncbi:tail fiber domain-containing protein [Ruegeria jejuensis]|uniref:tail fiber domain-containing protein n=1 Tax=Ruegeria jejuensis TaxID=3233338 RepID=UPI00355C42D8
MGGLFGLAGNAIIASDIRVKENVSLLSIRPDGLGVYAFDYKGGPSGQVGLMAQEVEQVYPVAALTIGDVKHINCLTSENGLGPAEVDIGGRQVGADADMRAAPTRR